MNSKGVERVLVTGGAGFIGSHVVDLLIESGYQTTILEENIKHLLPAQGFTFENSDVTKATDISGGYNIVVHFASRTSPEDCQQDQIETLAANSIGTQKVEAFHKAYVYEA